MGRLLYSVRACLEAGVGGRRRRRLMYGGARGREPRPEPALALRGDILS
jgi:hypothetical protein